VNDDELGAPRSSLAHEPSLEGAVSNIERWCQAVELTACRAGLIVSGDLGLAEQQLPGDLTPAEGMNELLRYFVSDECARVRQALGVTVA